MPRKSRLHLFGGHCFAPQPLENCLQGRPPFARHLVDRADQIPSPLILGQWRRQALEGDLDVVEGQLRWPGAIRGRQASPERLHLRARKRKLVVLARGHEAVASKGPLHVLVVQHEGAGCSQPLRRQPAPQAEQVGDQWHLVPLDRSGGLAARWCEARLGRGCRTRRTQGSELLPLPRQQRGLATQAGIPLWRGGAVDRVGLQRKATLHGALRRQ
mmetsp:Transcript_11879/g.32082  ORF Transcript_11879/g.32082 Transcript_11879/m.32082 type:complete len:215 (-) Transcript_11879:986-1630(-)